jgi:hypothetical protein
MGRMSSSRVGAFPFTSGITLGSVGANRSESGSPVKRVMLNLIRWIDDAPPPTLVASD